MNEAINNMTEATRALVSCDEDSQIYALDELTRLFSGVTLRLTWLVGNPGESSGVALVDIPMGFSAFAKTLDASASIWIRHIAPVHTEVALKNDAGDLPALQNTVLDLIPLVDNTQTLSVQGRLLGDTFRPFSRTELNGALFATIEGATGVVLDARNPTQVVSVCVSEGMAYLGVSLAMQNHSVWPGGQMRFRKDEEQISRAEFKLLEAISVFDLVLPERGTALDIGAAPGGWTRILRMHGLRVVAVDPAILHASLLKDNKVVAVRERIQNYRPREQFDLLVNDLKMDARDSLDISLWAAQWLQPGGLVVNTLKLPKGISAKEMREFIADDLSLLQRKFTLIGARQLFHNRSEITIAGRKK